MEMSDNSMNSNSNNDELSTRKKFLLFLKKEYRYTIILPLIFSIVLICCFWQSHNPNDNILVYLKDNILVSVSQVILIFLFIDLPLFIIDELSLLEKETKSGMDNFEKNITKKMKEWENGMSEKIDNCPRMTSFHTEGRVMEDKIEGMTKMAKSSQRWMYSKFISKLLSKSFDSFSIEFDQTSQYSDFSSDIMKECTESVYLTSSMTPHEWLFSLSDDSNKTIFFNNLSKVIKLNSSNHSKTLRGIPIKKKERVICLSSFDYDHLFLFEKSLLTYLKENEGINTAFYKWDNTIPVMKPLKYEYAMYDESLLFKYEKETKRLWVDKDGSEFNTMRNFFVKENKSIVKTENLINEIVEKKSDLLYNIQENKYQIPHKYAYLFHDNWTPFMDRSLRFGENARNAIADLLNVFRKQFFKDETIEIVEIGAGNGDKIDLVCDRIGTENISSYVIVDISEPLCRKSISLLNTRLKEKQNKSRKRIQPGFKVLDFCNKNLSQEDRTLFVNKTVLILNNSTLFSETDFDWNCLKRTKRIFITLDLFEDSKADELFDEYYLARELFLGPLKIYGIPIVKELVKGNKYRDFFLSNKSDPLYTNDDPFYKIYFKLNDYLETIKKDNNINYIPSETNSILEDALYDTALKEFARQEKIVVLSSLKFKEGANLSNEIESYFQKKLGDNWTVKSNLVSNQSYVGILCEREDANNSRRNGKK